MKRGRRQQALGCRGGITIQMVESTGMDALR